MGSAYFLWLPEQSLTGDKHGNELENDQNILNVICKHDLGFNDIYSVTVHQV